MVKALAHLLLKQGASVAKDEQLLVLSGAIDELGAHALEMRLVLCDLGLKELYSVGTQLKRVFLSHMSERLTIFFMSRSWFMYIAW